MGDGPLSTPALLQHECELRLQCLGIRFLAANTPTIKTLPPLGALMGASPIDA
jgi:hypothetical protein